MPELVTKSNALIQASYTLSLVEQRLILMSIVEARETGQGITQDSLLTVRALDYAELFGVTKHSAYKSLSEAVETLFNRRVTVCRFIDDIYEELTVRWVNAMSYKPDSGLIRIRFNAEVVSEITRLEENFTSYELEQMAGLNSAYAVRLYELLIQWSAVGKTPFFEIGEFRRQLGVDEHEYLRMHHFKNRILDNSIELINAHTDITVSYEQHKAGRTITGFSFKFKQKIEAIKAEITPKEAAKPKAGINPLKGVTDLDGFYKKHRLGVESMDETFKRLRKEADEGAFSLNPTD